MNMDFIIGPVVVATLCYFLYKIIQLYACRRERIIIAEKIEKLGNIPDSGYLAGGTSGSRFVALRWGAILLGLGLGLLAAYFITYAAVCSMSSDGFNDMLYDANSVVYVSCALLGGGLGMVSAFLMEVRMSRK